MKRVSIVLAGIGGYGITYVNALLDAPDKSGYEVVGMVDPYPEACQRLEEIRQAGIPIYESLERFYEVSSADLAVIATPIQYHGAHVTLALDHGSQVLCEKPLAATAEQGLRIIDAARRTGRFVAVGYQWSYSKAILDLKKDILEGEFGKPLQIKTLVLWPRNHAYYSRPWAGKKTHGGLPVYDSIANNAAAHYLHNMLFVLGDSLDTSAMPAAVTAELYRANEIENFDTAALKVRTAAGTELLFLASHAVERSQNPIFHYAFEGADIYCEADGPDFEITAVYKDGRRRSYGSPNRDPSAKLWAAVDAVCGGDTLTCTAITALPHTLCIDALGRSMTDITVFPEEMVIRDEVRGMTYARGLFDAMKQCYAETQTPSERGITWAQRGMDIDIELPLG